MAGLTARGSGFAGARGAGAAALRGAGAAAAAPAGARAAASRAAVTCKYGDNGNVFTDTKDMVNTTGNWDMYGGEKGPTFPKQQAEFFERWATGLERRETMFGFLGLSFASALLVWGYKGTGDIGLPITKGPQKPQAAGPRGKI